MSYLAMIDAHIDQNGRRSKFLEEKGDEVRKNAISNLCSYDPRSPSWFEDIGEMPEDCYCDCCFYGRHEPAVTILEMLDLLKG